MSSLKGFVLIISACILPIRPVPIKANFISRPLPLEFFSFKILTLGRTSFNKISNFPIHGYNKLVTKEGINGKSPHPIGRSQPDASQSHASNLVHSIPEAEVVAVCSIVQEELDFQRTWPSKTCIKTLTKWLMKKKVRRMLFI